MTLSLTITLPSFGAQTTMQPGYVPLSTETGQAHSLLLQLNTDEDSARDYAPMLRAGHRQSGPTIADIRAPLTRLASPARGTSRTRLSGKPPQTTRALVSGVFPAGVQQTSISQ